MCPQTLTVQHLVPLRCGDGSEAGEAVLTINQLSCTEGFCSTDIYAPHIHSHGPKNELKNSSSF